MKKNILLKSIKNDHADGYRSGSGLIRSILGDLELPSQKNHTFITIWKSWFSYEFPLITATAALVPGSGDWQMFELFIINSFLVAAY